MATIGTNEIAQAIWEGSQDKHGHALHAYAQNAVKFLVNKRHISKAQDILAKLQKITNKEEGIVEANISYAGKLGRDAKSHIEHALKKRYKARDVVLHAVEDASLVGGYRIEVEGEVIDLSIKDRINKLQEHLIK